MLKAPHIDPLATLTQLRELYLSNNLLSSTDSSFTPISNLSNSSPTPTSSPALTSQSPLSPSQPITPIATTQRSSIFRRHSPTPPKAPLPPTPSSSFFSPSPRNPSNEPQNSTRTEILINGNSTESQLPSTPGRESNSSLPTTPLNSSSSSIAGETTPDSLTPSSTPRQGSPTISVASPLQLVHFVNLQVLTLAYNDLTIFPNLVGCVSLQKLNLSFNRISEIPASLAKDFASLRELDLVSYLCVHELLERTSFMMEETNLLDYRLCQSK